MFSLNLTAHETNNLPTVETTTLPAINAYNVDPSQTPSIVIDESPLEVLIEIVGGDCQFDFLINEFCQNIQEDPIFCSVVKDTTREQLVALMSNMIRAGFSYRSQASLKNNEDFSEIIQRNFALFQVSLTRSQIAKLQVHFEEAMKDSWVAGPVFDHCAQRFRDLRTVLEEETSTMKGSSEIKEKLSTLQSEFGGKTLSLPPDGKIISARTA